MKINFYGDVISTNLTEQGFEENDVKALFGDTLSVMEKPDFNVMNFEGVLTESEDRIKKLGPNLKGHMKYAKVLKNAHFTHACLSNNHSVDFGVPGLRDSVKAFTEAGITCFGYGENDQDSRKVLYIEKDGMKVGVVAVCEHEYTYALEDRPGANPFDPFTTMYDVEEAKKNADYVVVLYHGGKELCQFPSPRLRKACQAMVHHGASLVLCQHSHCIGCHENYENGQIVYGTGNYNFVEDCSTDIQASGLITCVDFGKTMTVNFVPVVVREGGIELAKENKEDPYKDYKFIMDGFQQRSLDLLDKKKWMEEWDKFAKDCILRYEKNLRKAYEAQEIHQHVPHYLDCEAHLDVLMQAYKTWHITYNK